MLFFVRKTFLHSLVWVVLLTGLVLSVSGYQALAQDERPIFIPASEYDAAVAQEWMHLLYQLVEREGASAPAASRIYAYAGVTLYEATVNGMPSNYSLAGQLQGMSDLSLPDTNKAYDWPSVANSALAKVIPGLFHNPSEEALAAVAELRADWAEARAGEVDEQIVENSLIYGDVLGDELLLWIAEDGYADIVTQEYELPVDDAPWFYVLTTPGTLPNEPYWGTLRTFGLFYPEECHVPLNLSFSTERDSTFYAQALEVKETGDRLTREQEEIARFWVDTPGISGAPSGHWVSIQNQLVDQLDLNLQQAAGMYAQVGMAMADAFISAWSLKYEQMLLRPETYIHEYISRSWQPYIQTPPFPEYPSGHSVVSGAAAEMLTHLFGPVAFTDRTHIIHRHEPLQRSFTSFEAAAYEAAISRLYGGIHYRAAIENGIHQGRCTARAVINNVRLGPIPQGLH